MPIRKIAKDDIPPSRFQNSPIYETEEWKEVVKIMDEGLAPMSAVEITLSPETVAQLPLKDPLQAFLVAVRRRIKRLKLPIDAETRTDPELGQTAIYLSGRPAGGVA